MRKDELFEMMTIWINTTTLSNDTKARACANVAEIYHTEQLRILSVGKSFLYKDEKLVENMCFSFRHDFGLLPKLIQDDLRRDCKEWLRALENNQ